MVFFIVRSYWFDIFSYRHHLGGGIISIIIGIILILCSVSIFSLLSFKYGMLRKDMGLFVLGLFLYGIGCGLFIGG